MRILEQFEYPLPIIKADIEKIIIETSMDYEGSFIIKNVGSGTLSGIIASNSKSIKLSPQEISSNKVNVFYSLDLDIYKPGDMLRTEIIITSNGGEVVIPVIIKVTNEAIITSEGDKISSLKDFCNYAKKNPLEARQLFITSEFTMWLASIGYNHMEILDHLISDSNRERSVDNFLILSKLKKRAYITTSQKAIDIARLKNTKGIIKGSIPISRVGWGYLEANLRVENNSSWIKLSTDKITSSFFKDSDDSFIEFEVDTAKIKDSFVRDSIIISTEAEKRIIVNVRLEKPIKVTISKKHFTNDDSGVIFIENNSGMDLMIGVSTPDNYLKFEAKSYMIAKNANIPFNIKLTALQNTQLAIKKQPVIKTEIILRTIIGDKVFIKRLNIYIGNLLTKAKI